MVEPIEGMPGDALGFRISGTIDRDEYFQILDPVRERLERGERVSFLVATEPDFAGLEMTALWEDVKAAGSVGLRYRSSWERLALVTDKEWLRNAFAAMAWLVPGELRVFPPEELEHAKAWVGRVS
jgi:hypothetical protein